MSHHPRPSLSGVFDNVHVGASSSRARASAMNLRATLRQSISKSGFPNWRTLRVLSKPNAEPCDFTLKIDEQYRYYKETRGKETHDVIFRRAANIIQELRTDLSKGDGSLIKTYAEFTEEDMIHFIFGNNMQERAGQNFDITWRICKEIFAGKEVDAAAIDERSPEYEEHLQHLIGQGFEEADLKHVIRSRREVVQHAQALKYITDAALNKDQQLTEELLLETHRILCAGIPTEQGITDYEGTYRTQNVSAGGTWFTDWKDIPREMGKLIQDFNDDIKGREESMEMDPFYLAADVCQDFVTIHPFQDGNGRMCRLIANAFLIKYAGIVISIGEHDNDREEYLKIAMMAGDGWKEEQARGTLARFFLEKAERTLRKLKTRMSSNRQ